VAGVGRVSSGPASADAEDVLERGDDTLPLALLALFIAALVLVEAALIAPGHVLAGEIVDGGLLLALLNVSAALDGSRPSGRALQAVAAMRALALVPLARIVVAGVPLGHFSEALGELIVAAPIGFAAVRMAPLAGVDLRALAPARHDRSQAPAVLAGLGLGLIAYLLGAPPLVPAGADVSRVVVAVVAVIATAVAEELVFRGLVQATLQRVVGGAGVVPAALLFASTYLDAGAAALVLALALAGLVFGYSVARTGSLAGASAGHCVLSIGAVIVWPAVFGRSPSPWLDNWLAVTGLALGVVAVTLAAVAGGSPRESAALAQPGPGRSPDR
jgi:membrane protease YdiL (CAAX protease family)